MEDIMTKLMNAFSLNMVAAESGSASWRVISQADAIELLKGGFNSCIGHADTAAVISSELGLDVPAQRVTVALEPGESAIVAQYKGPRLSEGITVLPDGATIVYYEVTIS